MCVSVCVCGYVHVIWERGGSSVPPCARGGGWLQLLARPQLTSPARAPPAGMSDHQLLRDRKPAIGRTEALGAKTLYETQHCHWRRQGPVTHKRSAACWLTSCDQNQTTWSIIRRAPSPNLQWDFHAGNRRDSSLRCRRRTPPMTVAVLFLSRFYRKPFHKLPTRLPARGQLPRSSAGREVSLGTAARRSWGGRTHGERSVSIWASRLWRAQAENGF